MTAISDRYRKHADFFEAKVASVPADSWDQPSPCLEWDACGVVEHVCDSTQGFLGWVDKAVQVPPVDADPMAAWRVTRSAVEEALSNPEVADRVLERPMGTETFAGFVDRYLSFDLVIHAWDLARAAGLDDTIDLTMIDDVRDQASEMSSMGRKMGAFGDEVTVDEYADAQTKLLALLGRAQ